MSKDIVNKVKKFIQEYNLIQNGDNLIVGVSGGADSMMLLHFLYTYQQDYNIKLKVAHVHHGIREEAEADALFVEEVSRAWQLPYYRHNCNVKDLAGAHNISEEEAGRIERYNFFISLSNDKCKIVTAHNMNDQAETLIMRFLRGSGIKGLGGIQPQRDQIIRPLLCLKRKEIERYCLTNEVAYRDDHTNFMPIYTRNKIRLECIPYIEQNINPNIISLLGEHSHHYRESEAFLEFYTNDAYKKCVTLLGDRLIIDKTKFETYHKYIQRRIVLSALQALRGSTKDITQRHLESVISLLKLQSGKEISLPGRVKVYRQYEELIITWSEKMQGAYSYPLKLGMQYIPELRGALRLAVTEKETVYQKEEKMYTKYIDYGKIKNGLQIRTRLPHDYIATPKGTKKLKKMFIDDKIPKELRSSIPLIAEGDKVIWAVGSRLSSDYYITDETQEVLEIKIFFDNTQEETC